MLSVTSQNTDAVCWSKETMTSQLLRIIQWGGLLTPPLSLGLTGPQISSQYLPVLLK